LAACALFAIATLGCAAKANYVDVAAKEWKLTAIDGGEKSVKLDRKKLSADGFDRAFTIVFETDRVGGAGAPNRYFAPYKLEGDNAITIMPIAATQMAAIKSPEELSERDYFVYLQNAYKLNLTGGKLQLLTKDANGKDATLIFAGE
jgi:heat shock protein HslJ